MPIPQYNPGGTPMCEPVTPVVINNPNVLFKHYELPTVAMTELWKGLTVQGDIVDGITVISAEEITKALAESDEKNGMRAASYWKGILMGRKLRVLHVPREAGHIALP